MAQASNAGMTRNTSFAKELAEISQIRSLRRSKISAYPTLSVVIATVRPNDLENILKQMLKQSMPKFEILLGLHNIDLNGNHKALITKLKARKVTVSHIKFAKSATLGEILSTLCEKSTGEYISKIDDDDYYGPEHPVSYTHLTLPTTSRV